MQAPFASPPTRGRGRPLSSTQGSPSGKVHWIRAWLDKELYNNLKLLLTVNGDTLQHWIEQHAQDDTKVISPQLLRRLKRP